MRTLVSFEQAKYLDYISQTIYKIPETILMERAGTYCAEVLIDRLSTQSAVDARVLVLSGSGNNGGDAVVLARELFYKGYAVQVCLLQEAKTEVAVIQQDILKALSIPLLAYGDAIQLMVELSTSDWIVDGLTGIGLRTVYRDAQLIENINASDASVLSIDVPSGLLECKDLPVGSFEKDIIHPLVQARLTVTMGLEKTAMYVHNQRPYCGEILIAKDVFPLSAIEYAQCEAYIYEPGDIAKYMPLASSNSYKHSRGVLAIAAGCTESPGAALLATMAAAKGPAGLLYTLMDEALQASITANIPTAVSGRTLDAIHTVHAICAGSGWGTRTIAELESLLARQVPTVLDADALHIFNACNRHDNKDIVLTPHLGELRILTDSIHTALDGVIANTKTHVIPNSISSTEALSIDERKKIERGHWWAQAQVVADYYNVVVCAKNSVSYIVAPKRIPIIIEGSNPLMACGGSGDVLAGLMASVLAYFVGSSNYDGSLNEVDRFVRLQNISALAAIIHQQAGALVAATQGTGNALDIVAKIPLAYSIV